VLESLGSFEAKYEILERIGEGGMGAVYKVRHRLLDDVRVIKTMRATVANRMGARDRFFREARIAAKVRHENIAQVLDFAMDEDTAFLVLEFIDGVTLQDIFIATGPPSLRLALEIAKQSLRALAFVHQTGIIHRDISPDNLMLTIGQNGEPKIKLIDLGLAKITEDETMLTQDGLFLGKVRYAAPEQFQSDRAGVVGTWSDVYSFGLVFYELLTGHYPIRGRDGPGLLAGHLTQAPLAFEESDSEGRIPMEVRTIVLTSLEKNPKSRFLDAEAYHEEVRRIQMRYPLRAQERDEAIQLVQRLPTEQREQVLDASSDQSRIDGVFPADKSSAGNSHSKDVTLSVDEVFEGPTAAIDPRACELHRNPAGELAASPAASTTASGETLIRPHFGDFPGEADRRDRGVPQDHGPPQEREITPPSPRTNDDRTSAHARSSTARVLQKPVRIRRLWLLGLGAVAVTVAAVIVSQLEISAVSIMRRQDNTTANAQMNGTLILKATPWAEVLGITNADGEVFELSGSRYTPMTLSLVPGHYEVVVNNDEFGMRTIGVTVSASETITKTVALATISEEDLLRALGVME
jgi:serine/threonine protein kinase